MSMWAKPEEKKAVVAQPENKFASAVQNVTGSMKAGAGVDSRGREVLSNDRAFDAAGELNAYDRKDAFVQGERVVTLRQKVFAEARKQAGYSYSDTQRMLSDIMGDRESNYRFASDMVPLILQRLDYQGFCRQVFRVHQVQQGQIITYDEDLNTVGLVINGDGATIEQQIMSDRLFVPEFMVTANPTINIQQVLQRQYDIVDRLHDKTLFQIQMTEDRNALRQLYQAGQMNNDIVEVAGSIDKGVFEDMQNMVERHRLSADKFIMHRTDYGDIKKNTNSMDLDPVTSRELLLSGIQSSWYGVNIMVSGGVDEPGQENMSVSPGIFYCMTEGRYLGNMPVRMELSIMNADKFVLGRFEYSWLYGELIGQIVVNPRAVAVGIKTGSVIPSWLSR